MSNAAAPCSPSCRPGPPDAGDEALAATLRAFRGIATKAPFAEWPRRFWALLLTSPLLRHPAQTPAWAPPFAVLATLGSGPRAALLLRLVAGLSEADAAAVLGIARPTYRLALQRALPHREDGTPDAAMWHALGDAAQAAIRHLPAERLAHVARQREAAIHGIRPDRIVLAGAAAPSRPRWWRPALWGVCALTTLAVAATFVLPAWRTDDDGASRIRVEALPPAEAPASTFAADAWLPTHRDLDLLLDAGDDAAADPAMHDPGFYAWYAAQPTAGEGGAAQPPPPDAKTDEPPEDGASETSDAP